MCGRFTLSSSTRELERLFDTLPPAFELPASYNVAPAQEIVVIIQREDGRHIKKRHWGLVPFWAKEIAFGSRMINARLETVASKPAFKAAFKHRRCLIPANGFYEWKGKAGEKQPFYFFLPAGGPLAFAGLWESWEDKNAPTEAAPYTSCAIITTEAGDSVKEVHARMPLILVPEAWADWLDPANTDAEKIELLLKTRCIKELERYPVSKRVNRVENNSRELIEPLKVPTPHSGPKPAGGLD
jgi:putative SOS response-associated peptidase YedK